MRLELIWPLAALLKNKREKIDRSNNNKNQPLGTTWDLEMFQDKVLWTQSHGHLREERKFTRSHLKHEAWNQTWGLLYQNLIIHVWAERFCLCHLHSYWKQKVNGEEETQRKHVCGRVRNRLKGQDSLLHKGGWTDQDSAERDNQIGMWPKLSKPALTWRHSLLAAVTRFDITVLNIPKPLLKSWKQRR